MAQYILVLLGLALPSFYFLARHKDKIPSFIITSAIMLIVAVVWERLAYPGLWEWNDAKMVGWLFGLPVEEYIFAVLITIFVLGAYEEINLRLKKKKGKSLRKA
ncbi:hypothetical protein J4212_08230 [Candidatus Woesearchaeota archaeon]|nr:hypothetical protein [Candidatus Woesearchaeota archaeon]